MINQLVGPESHIATKSKQTRLVHDGELTFLTRGSGWHRKAWGVSPSLGQKKVLEPAERATALSSYIPFVVFNSIRLQELNEFIPKRNLIVMLLLVRNILAHMLDIRIADRECSVSALPGEVFDLPKNFMHPPICICL